MAPEIPKFTLHKNHDIPTELTNCLNSFCCNLNQNGCFKYFFDWLENWNNTADINTLNNFSDKLTGYMPIPWDNIDVEAKDLVEWLPNEAIVEFERWKKIDKENKWRQDITVIVKIGDKWIKIGMIIEIKDGTMFIKEKTKDLYAEVHEEKEVPENNKEKEVEAKDLVEVPEGAIVEFEKWCRVDKAKKGKQEVTIVVTMWDIIKQVKMIVEFEDEKMIITEFINFNDILYNDILNELLNLDREFCELSKKYENKIKTMSEGEQHQSSEDEKQLKKIMMNNEQENLKYLKTTYSLILDILINFLDDFSKNWENDENYRIWKKRISTNYNYIIFNLLGIESYEDFLKNKGIIGKKLQKLKELKKRLKNSWEEDLFMWSLPKIPFHISIPERITEETCHLIRDILRIIHNIGRYL